MWTWYPRCPEKKSLVSSWSIPRSVYNISRSFAVSSLASCRHLSQSQVCSSIRSFLHLGQSFGAPPFPVVPHALHFQLSLSRLHGVLRWSTSILKTRSAPMDAKGRTGADLGFDIDGDHLNTPC